MFWPVFSLAVIGLFMIYSASSVIAADRFSDSFYFVKRQAVFFTLGCGLMLITKKISYQMYKKRAPLLFFYPFSYLFLF